MESNTTLTKLDLSSEHQRNNTQMASINNPLFLFFVKSKGNEVGDTGALFFSDLLKINTTLKILKLRGEHKETTSA